MKALLPGRSFYSIRTQSLQSRVQPRTVRCSERSPVTQQQERVATTERDNQDDKQPVQVTAQVISSIDQVAQEEWDAVARSSGSEVNPFVQWSFLHALEASGSAARHEGWQPQHLVVRDQNGQLLGCCPLYLKAHSYGEYVFDQSWANYADMLGQKYYPKLQCCVPFSPVPGPRLLAKPGALRLSVIQALGTAMIKIADALDISSVHVTFNTVEEWQMLAELGFLQRMGIQYHWDNMGYSSFDDFLATLKQSKRKSVRQERKSMEKQGITMRRLTGHEVQAHHWDAFYEFYLNTVDKRWGTAYLTRDFFVRLGKSMPDEVLLMLAEEDGEIVAGALNVVGSHALYGRNWGCKAEKEYKNLHFELCYYQALDEAIARKLPRVEAGAQGEHKLQRGYLPNLTYSSHYIRDPTLRYAVSKFLEKERADIEYTWQATTLQMSPFKFETTKSALVNKIVAFQSSINSGGSLGSIDD